MYLLTTKNYEITERYISTSIMKVEKKIHQFVESISLEYDPSLIQHYQTIQRSLKKTNKYERNILNTKIIVEKLERL